MSLRRPWTLLYAATIALPLVLLVTSLRTFHELDAQREVYLRDRIAAIAGRLDSAGSQGTSLESAIASLAESEPHLRDLRMTSRAESESDPGLEAVWSGRELFHTEFVNQGSGRIYRAYVPFHVRGEISVAQIDLDAAASDFLLVHARHNVVISVLGGLVLLLISVYGIWAARRTADLERRHLELEHLAQLGTMSAVLAHEIRNPLGTIKGFAQLALEQGGNAAEPLLTPVVDQTKRLEALVNDLLVYGRPPVPHFESVRWTEVSARIDAAGHRLTDGRDATLDVSSSTDIAFITDPNLLEQILVNLLRNAIDAVSGLPDGRVRVAAEANGNVIRMVVSDNGPGIAKEHRERIKQPFFTTKAFGTGLGLPISIRLAESLHGGLDVQAGESGGTVAIVWLPLRRKSHGTDSDRG